MQPDKAREKGSCFDESAGPFRDWDWDWANIREAFYAYGRADFTAKPQIAPKECSEREYWLKLLIESGYYDDATILEQCIEVQKLLIVSVNTARSNVKQRHLSYCDAAEKAAVLWEASRNQCFPFTAESTADRFWAALQKIRTGLFLPSRQPVRIPDHQGGKKY